MKNCNLILMMHSMAWAFAMMPLVRILRTAEAKTGIFMSSLFRVHG